MLMTDVEKCQMAFNTAYLLHFDDKWGKNDFFNDRYANLLIPIQFKTVMRKYTTLVFIIVLIRYIMSENILEDMLNLIRSCKNINHK